MFYPDGNKIEITEPDLSYFDILYKYESYKKPSDPLPTETIQGNQYNARIDEDGFVYVERQHILPDNYDPRGWKFHINLDPNDLGMKGWDIVKEILVKHGVNVFKIANQSSHPLGSMLGREITIYPNHENPPRDWKIPGENGRASWEQIFTEITAALHHNNINPGMVPPNTTNNGRGSIERSVTGTPYISYRNDSNDFNGLDRYFYNPENGPKSIAVNLPNVELKQRPITGRQLKPDHPHGYTPGENQQEFQYVYNTFQEKLKYMPVFNNNAPRSEFEDRDSINDLQILHNKRDNFYHGTKKDELKTNNNGSINNGPILTTTENNTTTSTNNGDIQQTQQSKIQLGFARKKMKLKELKSEDSLSTEPNNTNFQDSNSTDTETVPITNNTNSTEPVKIKLRQYQEEQGVDLNQVNGTSDVQTKPTNPNNDNKRLTK